MTALCMSQKALSLIYFTAAVSGINQNITVPTEQNLTSFAHSPNGQGEGIVH